MGKRGMRMCRTDSAQLNCVQISTAAGGIITVPRDDRATAV